MNLFELFVKIGVDDQASNKLSDLSSKLGNGLKTAAKIGTAAVGAAATGIAALTTAAVNNYAEYEQLVGGVETLFKTSSDKVLEYAENAYKTAGLSANEYMDTVTSFSASLLQSLGGDTEAATEYANLAITDMADNANKMGSSIDTIQTAYAGFAKQNYTLLDNLKIGYGGTKEEMQRLIADAAELSDTVDAQSMSFDNIVEAIHVVQTEMGITGTTAKEAASTISGSIASMKSAWSNLVTGIADENAEFGTLVNNFVESASTVLDNILPRIEESLYGVDALIYRMFPIIMERIPQIISDFLPRFVETSTMIVQSIIDGISQNQEMLFETIFGLITYLAESFITMLPQIVELGLDLIVSLASGISENLPKIIPTIIDIINQIIETITENLPLLISSASEIIESLANGIAESLPDLIPTIVDVVIQIVDTMIDNVDRLVDAAIAIITALANGLISSLPRLIEKAPEIVENLVSSIVNNAPKLLKSALEIIVSLANGLIANIPQLVKVIPQIVTSIAIGFKSLMSQITDIGKNIVNGVWQGIQSMISWFTNKVKSFFSGIVNSVKNALGIHSPSKVFASIGKYMAEGLGEGWDDKFSDVRDEIDKSLDFDDPSMSINASVRKIGAEAAGIGGTAYGGTSIGTVIINIDGAKYSNENSLAEAIAEALQNMTDRRAAVYA